MKDWNEQHRPVAARVLKECKCGAQAVTDQDNCPRCGEDMEPMPDKKPSVRRST